MCNENPFDFTFVLSWCPKQGAIHVSTLAEQMLDAHECLYGFADVYARDAWVVIAVGPEGAIRKMANDIDPVVKAKFMADISLGLVKNQ